MKKKNNRVMEAVEFEDSDFFDDCPICQAMKKAKESGRDLTVEELKKLFKEANDKQGLN